MYYKVYMDQLFLEQVLLLVLLLKTWGKLGNVSLSWKKIWINSLLGAAAVCAVIFFRLEWGWKAKWVVLGALLLSTQEKKRAFSRRDLGWLLLTFLCSAAFYCGIFQIVFSIWEPPVLLAAVLAYTVLDVLLERRRERMALGEFRVRLTLEDQGEQWELTGLIDTGNHLTEPLTGRPVSILSWEAAEKLPRFQKIQQEQNGYLYLPFHSLGTEKGWMKGMVVDALQMEYRGERIRVCHPVVAVSREHLSIDNQYQMIVHPLHVEKQCTKVFRGIKD